MKYYIIKINNLKLEFKFNGNVYCSSQKYYYSSL